MLELKSIGKTIELRPYTRSIARAMNETLLQGVIINAGSEGDSTSIPAINTDRAEETAIRLLSGLDQMEIDSLSVEDYTLLKEALNEATKGKKKE